VPAAKWCSAGLRYLGEVNGGRHEAWCYLIEASDERSQQHSRLVLFPADREVPASGANRYEVQVRLDSMELHRPRQWGRCWLACQLYEHFAERLANSRLPYYPNNARKPCWRFGAP